MICANQVWDVNQAVKYTKALAEIKPWYVCKELEPPQCFSPSPSFTEEPTAPDDILGHAVIRRALKPYDLGAATGEHAHNRMVLKQLLQAEAIDSVSPSAPTLAVLVCETTSPST
jgi:L-fuconate dehydratase